MANGVQAKGGKKNRKHGRNRASSSRCRESQRRYTLESRWLKNADRRQKRHMKRVAKKAAKLLARAKKP